MQRDHREERHGVNDLERQYLIAAYELAKTNSMRMFEENDIANHLDLDPNEPGYVDRFIGITNELMDMGFVDAFDKGGGMGRRRLKLTRRGLEEGERLSDPVEQRKERRRRFLRVAYDVAADQPNGFVVMSEVAARLGVDPDDPREYGELTELAKYFVQRGYAQRQLAGFEAITLTAEGVDEVEGNRPQAQQNVTTFNVSGNFYQSAIGTHNTNTFRGDLDFSTVERRIEEEGGDDKEELREIVAEMRELLEYGGTIDKGFLARFNEKLKEHGWLAGAVAGWLLNFSTQNL